MDETIDDNLFTVEVFSSSNVMFIKILSKKILGVTVPIPKENIQEIDEKINIDDLMSKENTFLIFISDDVKEYYKNNEIIVKNLGEFAKSFLKCKEITKEYKNEDKKIKYTVKENLAVLKKNDKYYLRIVSITTYDVDNYEDFKDLVLTLYDNNLICKIRFYLYLIFKNKNNIKTQDLISIEFLKDKIKINNKYLELKDELNKLPIDFNNLFREIHKDKNYKPIKYMSFDKMFDKICDKDITLECIIEYLKDIKIKIE